MANDSDISQPQELKAAVHNAVGKICREMGRSKDGSFDRLFIASLAELTLRQISSYGNDLELFSAHAGRSTIMTDDVKLLCRKTPELLAKVSELCENTASKGESSRKSTGPKGVKKRKRDAS